jgi:hypothetical protein
MGLSLRQGAQERPAGKGQNKVGWQWVPKKGAMSEGCKIAVAEAKTLFGENLPKEGGRRGCSLQDGREKGEKRRETWKGWIVAVDVRPGNLGLVQFWWCSLLLVLVCSGEGRSDVVNPAVEYKYLQSQSQSAAAPGPCPGRCPWSLSERKAGKQTDSGLAWTWTLLTGPCPPLSVLFCPGCPVCQLVCADTARRENRRYLVVDGATRAERRRTGVQTLVGTVRRSGWLANARLCCSPSPSPALAVKRAREEGVGTRRDPRARPPLDHGERRRGVAMVGAAVFDVLAGVAGETRMD